MAENNLVKGFNDYTGEEAEKREEIRKILVSTFEKYGFEPAETPILEIESFVRGDNAQDGVVSDIFKLKDKGERNLALRYEFTFQLKRIAKNKKLPYKRYQIGPVFRDEPVSANRFRQLTQCDVDIIGSSIADEAEILSLAGKIIESLKVKCKIFVNSRKLLNEILDSIGISENKEQVLREIDKLDKLPEKVIIANLKKYEAEKILQSLKKPESYFKKYGSYKEIEELKKYCNMYGLKIEFLPSLVRGLSYYNGNVFEIKSEGVKETISAGGSYLINGVQSTGISFGLERLCSVSKLSVSDESILIVSLNKDKESIHLAEKLRAKRKKILVYYGRPSKALEYANSKKIEKVIFVGEEEIKKGKFKIKDLKTGKEEFLEKGLVV